MSNDDKKNLQENGKPTSTSENCGTKKIEPICDTRCKICHGEHLKTIHDLKRAGKRYDDIGKIMKAKFNFHISNSSLSRHFQKYNKRQAIISAEIINDELIEGATKQAAHTKKIVSLIDTYLEQIKNLVANGLMKFDIADLERLIKMRYQVLNETDTDENDIIAMFQKATDKYGVNLQQGVLFNSSTLQATGEQELKSTEEISRP